MKDNYFDFAFPTEISRNILTVSFNVNMSQGTS